MVLATCFHGDTFKERRFPNSPYLPVLLSGKETKDWPCGWCSPTTLGIKEAFTGGMRHGQQNNRAITFSTDWKWVPERPILCGAWHLPRSSENDVGDKLLSLVCRNEESMIIIIMMITMPRISSDCVYHMYIHCDSIPSKCGVHPPIRPCFLLTHKPESAWLGEGMVLNTACLSYGIRATFWEKTSI